MNFYKELKHRVSRMELEGSIDLVSESLRELRRARVWLVDNKDKIIYYDERLNNIDKLVEEGEQMLARYRSELAQMEGER